MTKPRLRAGERRSVRFRRTGSSGTELEADRSWPNALDLRGGDGLGSAAILLLGHAVNLRP
jgi:hypothetical protein